jgi:hypothetical protein
LTIAREQTRLYAKTIALLQLALKIYAY